LAHTDGLFVPLRTGLLEKWEFQIIPMMKLKLENMTAEGLSVATAEKEPEHWNFFFNVLEKVGTENNFSDTWEHFIFDDSGVQINNKVDCGIAGNVHVLTLGEKSENITVISGQFLPPVLIYEVVNKQEFGDGLPPGFRRVLEPEIVVHWHSLIHEVVQRALPQKQNIRERPSNFGWPQSSLQLPFRLPSDCCKK
jgi:hypothetical protein